MGGALLLLFNVLGGGGVFNGIPRLRKVEVRVVGLKSMQWGPTRSD